MSITGALNNALTGIRATGRASEVISSNIANALTPGYAARGLELSSIVSASGGVRIDGIVRDVDPQVLSDRRLASAEQALRSDITGYLDTLENLVGTPDQEGSLSDALADFDNALITAASRPDAPERLDIAVLAARDLAARLNQTSAGIQDARTYADASIAEQVSTLNATLQNVQDLNRKILAARDGSAESAGLMDMRQMAIDEISQMVPIRTAPRQDGSLAIYSTGGAILLDGQAVQVDFTPARIVTPYMSTGNGTLSGLSINGVALDISSDRGALRGGSLGAQFEIRDEMAVEAQAQLDAIARDMIERFADPAVDPTLAPTDPGLFTDNGLAFDPLDEVGIARRITVNAAVDPANGGESWRLRDGINAAAPGDSGDATLLQSLSDALTTQRLPASGTFGTSPLSSTQLTSTFLSQISVDRMRSDQQLTFASARFDTLKQMELERGVDSDAELQRLIQVEQAYAANARIIQAAEEMMQTLMRLG